VSQEIICTPFIKYHRIALYLPIGIRGDS